MKLKLSLPCCSDPAQALAAVLALRQEADELERQSVARAIEQGWSWAKVAESLGLSRQAAHKKFSGLLKQ